MAHTTLGGREVVVPNVVPRLSDTPGRVDRLGPELGEGNAEVYGRLCGLTEEEMAGYRKRGVI